MVDLRFSAMGILTNPQTREKLVRIVSKYNNPLCVLCYIAGVAWFTALAYKPMNAGTYFSENALLPGLVTSDFKHDHGAGDYYKQLKEELRAIKDQVENMPQRSRDDTVLYKLPSTWFERQFRDLGLDAYVQNYTFTYPAAILKEQKFSGQNVYGILRAPRAAGTEALVLSVPYRPPGADADRTGTGIALMLALAKAFRRHTYWAKDIIFLVTENEQVGMQAWLSAYHYDNSGEYLWAGELEGRSGSIQAAINLEVGMETISRINLKAEGLNGQLPNLDLINTVCKLCRREGLMPAVQKRSNHHHPESRDGFEHSLRTMADMMWLQATNSPSANHGLFHRYHIEALTMQGMKMKNSKREHSMQDLGRVLEGLFRSLNNLLERFHQSFFFYLLPATDRYVSIGLYMPPFGVLALPIIIKAISLWIAYMAEREEKDVEKPAEESQTEEDEKPEAAEETDEADTGKTAKEADVSKEEEEEGHAPSPAGLLPPLVMSVMLGLCTYRSPWFFVETARAFRMQPQEGLALGAVAMHLAGIMFPRMLHRKSNAKGGIARVPWRLHKCVGLLGVAVVMAALGVINISLAVILTAVWTPVLLIVRPTQRRVWNFLQYLLLLAVSPLGMLYLACIVQHTVFERSTVGDDTGTKSLWAKAWMILEGAVMSGVVESGLFANWLFPLVTCVLFPLWLMFWSLMWAEL